MVAQYLDWNLVSPRYTFNVAFGEIKKMTEKIRYL